VNCTDHRLNRDGFVIHLLLVVIYVDVIYRCDDCWRLRTVLLLITKVEF
jgi:hypothetical protein